jgi:hypothetical protein
MAHSEDLNRPQPPSRRDENADRRWVIGAFVALLMITGFFVVIGHVDLTTSSTTGQASSEPEKPGPSAGSSSLPKGPGD